MSGGNTVTYHVYDNQNGLFSGVGVEELDPQENTKELYENTRSPNSAETHCDNVTDANSSGNGANGYVNVQDGKTNDVKRCEITMSDNFNTNRNGVAYVNTRNGNMNDVRCENSTEVHTVVDTNTRVNVNITDEKKKDARRYENQEIVNSVMNKFEENKDEMYTKVDKRLKMKIDKIGEDETIMCENDDLCAESRGAAGNTVTTDETIMMENDIYVRQK